ncbi:MAG: Rrf2 family transcriptional regulator [Deltaproteobacteria bacterium]|nr:Rrf2 family transcriptional regulator [Deltaproteobacteria bacterium]
MRLTRYTDYSLRVLIHLGLHPERLYSVAEIARVYTISQHHLTKVVNALARDGYVTTVRGRNGGMRLGAPPETIAIGEVIRRTEDGLALAECGPCALHPACDLAGVLAEGVEAMLAVFDRYTLADLLRAKAPMLKLLAIRGRTQRRAPVAV